MLEARPLRRQGAGRAAYWAAGVWLSSCTLELDVERYRFVDPAGLPAADSAVPAAAGSGATNDSDPSQLAGPNGTPEPPLSAATCALGSSRLGRCTLRRNQ
jgi:hypothetical protein